MDISGLIPIVGLLVMLGAFVGVLSGSWLFSVSPEIHKGPGWLIARTSFRGRLLSLFSMRRTVTVDAQKRMVTIADRLFWFAGKRRAIPFTRIEKILYSLCDLHPLAVPELEHHTIDDFQVCLGLVDGSELTLFQFVGPGAIQTGWDSLAEQWIPDAFYDFFNRFQVSGAQAVESRQFVNQLQHLIGVPVERGSDTSRSSASDQWWSAGKMCLAIGVLVAVVMWGIAAADYRTHQPPADGRRIGPAAVTPGEFLFGAVVELPHAFSVLAHAIHSAIWIPCVLAGVEVGVFIVWLALSRLERKLTPSGRRTRRRSRE